VLRTALWLALALSGQAVALQLIEAGPTVRFQHYVTLQDFSPADHLVPSAILLAQILLVAVGVFRRRGAIIGWLRRSFRPWQLAAILSGFVLSSAVLSKSAGFYVAELPFASGVQLISLGNVFLVVASLPTGTRLRLYSVLDRFLRRDKRSRGRSVDGFAAVISIWVVAAAAFLSTMSYQRHPHVPDEVIYLLQAKYFAAGMVTLPVPPVPEAFDIDITVVDGDRWYSPAPPGWPAILALGERAGFPWLVNPLLAGLCILLAYSLISQLYDRPTARLTIALLAVSPWFLFMGMNFMTHTSSLAAALLAGLGTLRARRTGRLGWIGLAGVSTGLLALIRPLEAVAIGSVIAIFLLGRCANGSCASRCSAWSRRPPSPRCSCTTRR
jgi:4-amino-4-deoxy-L-arabinose transferase-like glycosyltransferase